MAELKPGDVVQLKSDLTKKMTIETLSDDGYALCVWIDKTKRGQGRYHIITLQRWINPVGVTRLR